MNILLIFIIVILICFFLFINKKTLINKIYLINLKRRNDRLNFIKNNYNLSKPLIIIEAVDANLLNLEKLKEENIINDITIYQLNKEREHHYELTHKGSLGCYLSHYNIWKQFKETKDNNILIFEDDTIFENISINDINKRLLKLPKDWDIYLLSNPLFCYNRINLKNIYKDLYKVKRFFLLNSYIINKKAIYKIFNSNTLFPITQQLDSYLSELAIDYNLNIYIHNEKYKFYNQSINYGTDIQEPSKNILSYNRYKLKK